MTRTPGSRLSRREFASRIVKGWAGALALTIGLAAPLQTVYAASPTKLQFWFIRHAESEINVPGAPRPVPDAGVSYPLTLTGVEQARTLTANLRSVPITKIYTSTALRAIQTADALAFDHRLTLSLAPEAVEIDFGLMAGSGQDGRTVYTDLARKWLVEKDLEARNGAGESFADVQRRFLPFVRELMNRHALDSGVIVIVAHSGTLAFMVPVLATNVPPEFAARQRLPNTGIIKTELRDNRLFCTEWAGIASTEFGTPEREEPATAVAATRRAD